MAPGDPSERHSNHVAVVRLILAAASLATVLGLICVAFVPASGRIIDIAAAIFALATWVVPPLLAVKSGNKKRSSLASVGFVIGLFVVAACLSVMGVCAPHLVFHEGCKLGLARSLDDCSVLGVSNQPVLFRQPSSPDGQRRFQVGPVIPRKAD
jgi:hypothetical protein